MTELPADPFTYEETSEHAELWRQVRVLDAMISEATAMHAKAARTVRTQGMRIAMLTEHRSRLLGE